MNTHNLPTSVIDNAAMHVDQFNNIIEQIPYEEKGVLYSEIFFIWLCLRESKPNRILESGRARGQSTLLLSHCFPDTEIISVEFEEGTEDAKIANDRLSDRDNVTLLFGDSTERLQEIAQPGDIAFIDGPKGYRGLRLAVRMLSTHKIPYVFMHDTFPGSHERRYLEHRIPDTFYSDHPQIASIAHQLDLGIIDNIPETNRWPPSDSYGYGCSMACIPYDESANYTLLLLKAILDGIYYRHFKKS